MYDMPAEIDVRADVASQRSYTVAWQLVLIFNYSPKFFEKSRRRSFSEIVYINRDYDKLAIVVNAPENSWFTLHWLEFQFDAQDAT